MDKPVKLLTCLVATLYLHNVANANIIGVLTESVAQGTIFSSESFTQFTGAQISEQIGGPESSAAAIWDSTSKVGVNVVEFKNGNASWGDGVRSRSRTVVEVSFQNTGNTSVLPTLNSQITPAGMGIYMSDCDGTDIRLCGFDNNDSSDWQDVGDLVPEGEAAAGTYFDFRVVSGSDVLFELTGGLSLVRGIGGAPNFIRQEFGRSSVVLNNFRQTSAQGSQQQITFDWDATDFLVEFPASLTLDPGEIGSVTYITEVTTFSNAFCLNDGQFSCPLAYGAFGDPIGRGGSSNTRGANFVNQMLARANITQNTPSTGIGGLDVGLFEFNYPTFENGQLTYRALSGPGITTSIPAPAPIALMLLCLLGLGAPRIRLMRQSFKQGIPLQSC